MDLLPLSPLMNGSRVVYFENFDLSICKDLFFSFRIEFERNLYKLYGVSCSVRWLVNRGQL